MFRLQFLPSPSKSSPPFILQNSLNHTKLRLTLEHNAFTACNHNHVLSDDMIVLAEPNPSDIVHAIQKAISMVPKIDAQVMHNQFEGAYKMIGHLKEMNFKPMTNMYNAIMASVLTCMLEKNINGGLRVLKHMLGANIKPDSQTFFYLISNCEIEEDIIKSPMKQLWLDFYTGKDTMPPNKRNMVIMEDENVESENSHEKSLSNSKIDSSSDFSHDEDDLFIVRSLINTKVNGDSGSHRENIFHSRCHIKETYSP
ncbi:Pentatricopeptide repeat-containing protein, mitochondrial, partial [Mucuna pruriens]